MDLTLYSDDKSSSSVLPNAALAPHNSLVASRIGGVRLCHHDLIERIILIRPRGNIHRPGFALFLQQRVLQPDDQSLQPLPVIRLIVEKPRTKCR